MVFVYYIVYTALLLPFVPRWLEGDTRIYHGTLDEPGSGKFPYHVQLGYRNVRGGKVFIAFLCGGTLITLRYYYLMFFKIILFIALQKDLHCCCSLWIDKKLDNSNNHRQKIRT